VTRPLDDIDRRIINGLQGGLPLCDRPYEAAAGALGLAEDELIARLKRMLGEGALTRFGPMYNADRMGGRFELCALAAPADRFDEVAVQVNAHAEVAHNYARDHALNMWFVLASDEPGRLDAAVAGIEADTGLEVQRFPKLEEYFIGLRVEA
jgi:DNA-binding Lrp family transcriptional regulator